MRTEEVGFPLVFLTPTVRSAEAPWPRGLPHAGCGAGAARCWASRTPRVRPVLATADTQYTHTPAARRRRRGGRGGDWDRTRSSLGCGRRAVSPELFSAGLTRGGPRLFSGIPALDSATCCLEIHLPFQVLLYPYESDT